jgi:hypothetical protein
MNIYIVNTTTGGMHCENSSYYHRAEAEARADYKMCLRNVSDDPAVVELICLDTDTLEAVTLEWWSGNIDNLEEEEEDESAAK